MSDHSSPAAVPTFSESKKRMRGENVERFFDDVKREKIEPIPTKGAEPRPDFLAKLHSLFLPLPFPPFSFTHREYLEELEGKTRVVCSVNNSNFFFSFFFFLSYSVETLNFLVSANEMIETDPEFLSNFDLNESFDFLQTLKRNIESMPTTQLNTLLGKFAPHLLLLLPTPLPCMATPHTCPPLFLLQRTCIHRGSSHPFPCCSVYLFSFFPSSQQ